MGDRFIYSYEKKFLVIIVLWVTKFPASFQGIRDRENLTT